MTQPDVQRSGIQLDKIATMFVILVCLLGSVWIARDLAYGGTPPRVVAGNRARTPPPPPVEAAPLPKEPISIAGAATKGSPQAKVALVIYSDFECPFCARFANDTWPALDSKYVASGRVRVAFRHLPLEKIHSAAVKAAEATECASQQGQFWQMHDVLFKNPKQLTEPSLFSYAQEIRLNVPAFETCLKGATTDKVRADVATASALGISGTPAFLLGTIQADGRVKVAQRIAGARPLTSFEAAIDKVLGASASGTK